MNQLYIYICSHISSLLHLPPSHPPYPTPPGGHNDLFGFCLCVRSGSILFFPHVYPVISVGIFILKTHIFLELRKIFSSFFSFSVPHCAPPPLSLGQKMLKFLDPFCIYLLSLNFVSYFLFLWFSILHHRKFPCIYLPYYLFDL